MIYGFYVMFYWFFYGIAPSTYITVGNATLTSFRNDTAPFWEWLLSWPSYWLSGVSAPSIQWGDTMANEFDLQVLPYVCAVAFTGVVLFLVLRLAIYLFSLAFGRRAR